MVTLNRTFEEVIDAMLETKVPAENAKDMLIYMYFSNRDELRRELQIVSGRAVLNSKDLQNVGITKANVKLLRYIDLILHNL